ncbi:MAG: FAD-binding oxidoreductase [Crocinitomicaceae bacterium]|jgi:ring-1,2-phenylacetyl-CoA epoxidase subunit PaaE
MALFKKLFSKSSKTKTHKGFFEIPVLNIEKLTSDTVKVTLDIPAELKNEFNFKPGQYLDFNVELNGKEVRRSYSICSGINEPISVAIKEVAKGTLSKWFNNDLAVGDVITVSHPMGTFSIPENAKKIVAIAAGSGITPIMAFAKDIEAKGNSLELFFGNRTEENILFHSEIDAFKHTKATYFLSGEEKDGFVSGRIDTTTFSILVKEHLQLLKADAFLLCGPEKMIAEVSDVLKMFGVSENKINYELFTTPVLLKSKTEMIENKLEGEAKVTVILDAEKTHYNLAADGPAVLDKVNSDGLDAPYSCKGGVCGSCRAKVLEGSCTMTMNYSLTDKEVEEGYILTCQAHPSSQEVVISYDA